VAHQGFCIQKLQTLVNFSKGVAWPSDVVGQKRGRGVAIFFHRQLQISEREGMDAQIFNFAPKFFPKLGIFSPKFCIL